MLPDRIPMSREGYDKLKAELDHMREVEMPAVTARVAAARDEGDLKENAEYHGARESQGMLQRKISILADKLSRAVIVEGEQSDKDKVGFGATVRFMDLDYDEEIEYTLVGAGDEDRDKGHILFTCPLGQSLAGKKVGDEAEMEGPRRTRHFKILEIKYE